MTMPNFLIIGAAKSGTTSLYHYLKQHPQVYMSPNKEPDFFALEGRKLNFDGPDGKEATNRRIRRGCATNIEEYRTLFRGVSDETAIGEASTWYLYSAQAPGRIKVHIPKAKLIAVLRNPVERAYSAFLYLRLRDQEPLSEFSQALQAEQIRKSNNWDWWWYYKDIGFYYVQLKRYFDTFGQDQIRVYLYEDLKAEPLRVVQSVFRFVGVDNKFVPDFSRRYNPSGVPKDNPLAELAHKPHNPVKTILRPLLPAGLRWRLSTSLLYTRLKNWTVTKPPPLPPEIRGELTDLYREDVLKLQDLIGRDLSVWLK
jgi:sulfotransferase family protein